MGQDLTRRELGLQVLAGTLAAAHGEGQATPAAAERAIALLLFDDVTLLDLVGPLQVLRGLPPPFRTVVVGESRRPPGLAAFLQDAARRGN